MSQFLLRIAVNALALWVAALLVPGITLGSQGEPTGERLLGIVLVALLFGVLNALVKPIVTLLSLPLIIVTLGLFMFIVNALMLWVLSWAAGALGLAFHVDSFFWAAVLGSLVVTVVSMLLAVLLPDGKDHRRAAAAASAARQRAAARRATHGRPY